MIKLSPILKEVSNITGPVRYNTRFGGHEWSVKFDVNKNPTKIGVKLQFIPKDPNLEGTELNSVGNDLAAYLQKQFSEVDIVIDRDKDFKDKFTAIGFIIPLDSLSQWVMTKVIKGDTNKEQDAGSEELN
jgi:hypothetical protein